MSLRGLTIKSSTLPAILLISNSDLSFEIIDPFPSMSLSVHRIDRLAAPRTRFSPACVFNNAIFITYISTIYKLFHISRFSDLVTLSSVDSSQKNGIDLAHSTSSKSCCFIDSAISLAVAIRRGFVSATCAPIFIVVFGFYISNNQYILISMCFRKRLVISSNFFFTDLYSKKQYKKVKMGNQMGVLFCILAEKKRKLLV